MRNNDIRNMLGDIPGKRVENEMAERDMEMGHALMDVIARRLYGIESSEGRITVLFTDEFGRKMKRLSVGCGEPGMMVDASFYRRPKGLDSRVPTPSIDSSTFFLGIDSIRNGVTFGGVRLLQTNESSYARTDALRLSHAMTHKLSMIGEPYGGSKMVVLVPETGKSESLLHKIGEIVEALNGMFITAIDFGFEPQDALKIRERTKFILGFEGPGSLGASGVTTALGAFAGIRSILTEAFGSPQIAGRSFAIQGLGSVGSKLAELILESGGRVFLCDNDDSKLGAFRGMGNVSMAEPQNILFLDVDVLCPSGPAYVINPFTIERLRSRAVAGVANCVLEDEVRDDRLLREKGILFAPDFVLNAGGVIQGIEEYKGNGLKDAIDRLPVIPKNLRKVFRKARRDEIGTMAAAKEIARARRAVMGRGPARRQISVPPSQW